MRLFLVGWLVAHLFWAVVVVIWLWWSTRRPTPEGTLPFVQRVTRRYRDRPREH